VQRKHSREFWDEPNTAISPQLIWSALMPSIHGPQWDRDEEYRQSVIRKALLLGFECEEYMVPYVSNRHVNPVEFGEKPMYRFKHGDLTRGSYGSIYSAAFDYLRLVGLPLEVIGAYRG
jgi:hypothetical protein